MEAYSTVSDWNFGAKEEREWNRLDAENRRRSVRFVLFVFVLIRDVWDFIERVKSEGIYGFAKEGECDATILGFRFE